MMIRVIYRDQTAGVIESHLLDELIMKGRIVAYHSIDRWIPVESKCYRGDGLPTGFSDRIAVQRRYNAH